MHNTVESRFTKENEFWSENLNGGIEISKFPFDFKRQNPQKYDGAAYNFKFPDEINERLILMSNGSDYALYMILLTGIRFLLGKHLETDDATIIMPVFRQSSGAEALINSILPLRINTDNVKGFKELLLETKKVVTQANLNQNYPIISNLKLQYGENGIPVLNTVVLLDSIHEKAYLQGLGTDVLFNFIKKSNAIELEIEYNSLLYKHDTIRDISKQLAKYFEVVMKQPSILIDGIIVMSEEESERIHSKLKNFSEQDNGLNTSFSREYVEEKLLSILKKQLGNDEIGLDDDFFYDLGGNSLIAISFWSEVTKELNFELPLSKIFGSPTIRGMAGSISSAVKGSGLHIEPIPPKDYYPVSAAQERMYIINQTQNGGKEYNIPVAMAIDGVIDIVHLNETFKKLIQRHESLRTSFRLEEGRPVQAVHQNVDFEIEYIETLQNGYVYIPEEYKNSSDDDKAQQNLIYDIIEKFRKPFDLGTAPLFRATLVKMSENRHVMILDTHHIISDGMSMSIITRDFINLYEGKELPELRIQYKDFSKWQNDFLRSAAISKQEEYWVNTFTGELPVLNMLSDYSRPALQSLEGDEILFRIDNKLSEKLKSIVSETGSTLYMLLLTAYTTLLYKYTEQQDIIVGSPVAGRLHPDLENVTGMFVNTLAMRNYPQHEKSFREFLREVRNNTLSAFENQDYQFEMLIKKLDLQRDMSRNPLFDTMFILQNIKRSKLEISNLNITPFRFKTGNSKFDIVLVAEETDKGIDFSLEYCTRLYKKERMQKLTEHFVNILQVISENPDLKLAEIDMLSQAEKQQILIGFNNTKTDYQKEKTIHRLFEEQVEKTPDNIALVFEDRTITYAELNKRANQLAHILMEKGVKPDQLVGIAVMRSIEMIAAILGVLKAGGAYLPIDIEYPEERIRYMLDDSGAGILLTQSSIKDKFDFSGEKLCVDDHGLYSEGNSNDCNPGNTSEAGNLAYVIYTSGSTGKPKGVMLEHRSVNNFIVGMTEKIDFLAGKTILAVTTISFDIFVLETLLPLAQGLKVVIANDSQQKEPGLLSKLIKEQNIDIFQSTPSRVEMLLEYSGLEVFSGIKEILVGGEAFPKSLLNELAKLKNIRIYNMYGPTETTVWSAVKELTGVERISIGRPIANTRIYILSKNNCLRTLLSAGELCIAGDGLARGYLNRSDLTDEKFVSDPFRPGEKMYRTGDLAMWLPDGEVEFLGRIDHQVKIRGYRIEIGEIETQLLKYVKEAVVIDKENSKGNKFLCAYVVQEQKLEVSELRGYLSTELPKYMIPSYFVQLEKLPLTPNGKLDRKALPEPGDTMLSEIEYVAPSNEMEEIIARTWQNTLSVERVGIYDNYFDLGGDSIKAIKVISELEEHGLQISIGEIFGNPVLHNLAQYIASTERTLNNASEQEPNKLEVTVDSDKKDTKNYSEKKELKIIVQGDIHTYLSHALPMCVVLADEETKPWYYEHFINIFSNVDNKGHMTVDFLEYRAPYKDIVHESYLGYEFFDDKTSIVEFLINRLNNNYYIIIHLDEYYIPDKQNYMKEHFVRHSLIYGYDNIRKSFSAIGFNASGMFGKINIGYSDLISGFDNGKIHYKESAIWCETNAVEMLKLGKIRGEYPFDINKLKNELKKYIEAKGDFSTVFSLWSERITLDRDRLSYGIDVYDALIAQISNMSPEKITADYRAFHLIYEQKKAIYLRVKYAYENYIQHDEIIELSRQYKTDVVEEFNKLRVKMLNLEYTFKLSKDSINMAESLKVLLQMCSSIISIKNREFALINKIVQFLP